VAVGQKAVNGGDVQGQWTCGKAHR
jgi:hypothetical protein